MSSESKKIKLAIITNMLAPYRIPLFEIINAHPRIELLVIVMDLLSEDRQAWRINEFKFPCLVMKKKTISFQGVRYDLPMNLIKFLKTFRPDVIVSGGYSFSSIIAILYARISKVPFYIWSGETLLSYKMSVNNIAQQSLRKLLIQYSSGFIAYGPDAKQYLLSFGIEERKVHVINNICDSEPFFNVKKEWKLQDISTILYVGALTNRKNVFRLVHAYQKLHDVYPLVRLKLVGDGPLCSELEDFRRKHNLSNLCIQGEVPSTEIPKIMSESDFLILPSIWDRWPHVILEAMASGLPVLCSNTAGIPSYIVRDGENGYFFNPNSVEDIRDSMEKMIRNRDHWPQMSHKSLRIAKEYSIERTANLFIDAILAAL